MKKPLPSKVSPAIKATEKVLEAEQRLVCGLVDQEKWAYSQLYQMYSASLFGVMMNMVNCTETAEDLLQETFVKIFRSVSTYSSERSRLFTWMINISRNTCIDYLRRRNTKDRMQHDHLDDIMHRVENENHQSQFTDGIGVRHLLFQLPAKQKLVLEMIYFQGYTHHETAERLNMPLGSVKTSIRLAIISLRENFILPVCDIPNLAS